MIVLTPREVDNNVTFCFTRECERKRENRTTTVRECVYDVVGRLSFPDFTQCSIFLSQLFLIFLSSSLFAQGQEKFLNAQ